MSGSLVDVSGELAKENQDFQLVIFTLAGCELALEIHQVREIIRVSEITLMPKAPKFLEGIINLRGRIFPVLDLKKRFDMPLVEKTDETRILVAEMTDQLLGLLVDKVVEVLKIGPAAIQAVGEPVLTLGTQYVKGLLKLQDRLILLLNLEQIFTLEEVNVIPGPDSSFSGEGKKLGH